jgi:hypothetical protein
MQSCVGGCFFGSYPVIVHIISSISLTCPLLSCGFSLDKEHVVVAQPQVELELEELLAEDLRTFYNFTLTILLVFKSAQQPFWWPVCLLWELWFFYTFGASSECNKFLEVTGKKRSKGWVSPMHRVQEIGMEIRTLSILGELLMNGYYFAAIT